MAYIKHFIAVLLTCGVQYACSFGLIVLGYYSNWIYFGGGFVIWFIVFGVIIRLFFWDEKKLSIKDQNKIDTSLKVMLFFVLVASFWINVELIKVHDNYEYDNYGETTKAVVAKKYSSRTGKGSTLHYIDFSFEKGKQKIIRKYSCEKEECGILKMGDTVNIMYSTRNTYFTEKFTKIIP